MIVVGSSSRALRAQESSGPWGAGYLSARAICAAVLGRLISRRKLENLDMSGIIIYMSPLRSYIPFHEGVPFDDDIERMRLLLSTFCDGSGATNPRVPWTVPDYRDFERVVAEVSGGRTPENKDIFDVYVPVPNSLPFGISCKMAGPGSPLDPSLAFIELSNSSKKFTDAYRRAGIEWFEAPQDAGTITVQLVESWHQAVARNVDLEHSSYLLLTHSNDWQSFRLSSFSLDLSIADPASEIEWVVRCHRGTGRPNALVGYFIHRGSQHRIWELYPESGGQLKYRPMWDWANWTTSWFGLQQPPVRSLSQQARSYFPDLWPG